MSGADRNALSEIDNAIHIQNASRDKQRMFTCKITMEGNDRTSEFSRTRLRIFPTSLLRYYLGLSYFHFHPFFLSPSDLTISINTVYSTTKETGSSLLLAQYCSIS